MNKLKEYVSLYIKNPTVRLNVSLLVGFLFNGLYIIFNLVSGILYGNAWFITVAAYYALIVLVRYLVMGTHGKREVDKYDTSRTAGYLMMILGVPVTGMIIFTVIENREYRYSKTVLTAFAIYAVFSILRAVFGIITSRKDNAPMRRAAHTVRLSAALMSLFNFQTALFSCIALNESLSKTLNFITGATVSLSVFALAANTVKVSEKELNDKKTV